MADANVPRFSDHELHELRTQVENHLLRFENHLEQDGDWKRQNAEQLQLVAESNRQLSESLEALSSSTKDVVELYNNVQGTVKVGAAVQSLFLWLVKWGVVGAFLVGVADWALDRFQG